MSNEPTATTVAQDFSARVSSVLDAAGRRHSEHAHELRDAMARREALEAAFEGIAATLHQRVIRPRLEVLTARFEGVRVEHARTSAGVHTRCVFPHSDRYPASVSLTLGILLDADRGAASVFQSLEIIPILFDFERGSHMDVSLDQPDERAVADWVEGKLLAFLETYLRVETDPNYQRVNGHVDPVCGMRIQASAAEQRRQFRSHTYYFCSSTCEQRFAADPEFYVDRRAQQLEA